MLVQISAPGSIRVDGGAGRLVRVLGPTWDVEDVERQARTIMDSLTELDRESASSQESLIEDLIAFELKSRSIERAEPPRTSAERVVAEARLARLQEARRLIVDTSQIMGLDHLLLEARIAVGIAAEGEDVLVEPSSNPSEAIRIRRIGEITSFRGVGPSVSRPGGLTWRVESGLAPDANPVAFGDATTGLGLVVLGTLAIATTGHRRWLVATVLVGVSLLVLIVWAPIPGLGLLGIGLLGWWTA